MWGEGVGLVWICFVVVMEKRVEGEGVCWIGIKGEIGGILIVCGNLKVIGRVCVGIVDGMLVEGDEGGMGMSVGVSVCVGEYME